jgi:23S rRNA (uracil1939-C5)-methyltransferase
MLNSPCPHFPACGGCDFLNLEEKEYRELKIKTLPEADWLWVGPHSRRKINLQISGKNELGFFAAKSNSIIEISACFTAEEKISALILPLKKLLKTLEQNLFTQASLTLFDNGLDLVLTAKKTVGFSQIQKLTSFAKEQNLNISCRQKNHLTPVFLVRRNQIFYPDFKIELDSEAFLQATKSGLESIIEIIRNFLIEPAGKLRVTPHVADLYAGFGAYSFAIHDLVKSISAFEGDGQMVDAIKKNAAANSLSPKIKAEICDLFTSPIGQKDLSKFDLAIINPPRNGASPQILEISKSSLKNLIYVSCNPESFRRDAKILTNSGFKIARLIALDQFYSTKHLELISIFQKS